MKICSRCKLEKNLSDFNKNKARSDGYNTFCKDCNKNYQKQHYLLNKDTYKSDNINRRLELQQFAYDYLKEHSCVDCKESDPVVLDFDHISDKISAISVMTHNVVSVEKLKSEIAKCEVRCANCHRRKTAKDQNWYKNLKL